jgi:hypothetical protein
MDASDQLRRDLLLASAFFHAPAPRDRVYANCFRVIRHALVAADLWDDRFSEAFHGDDESMARFPVVATWYSTLIELTRHEPQPERLLNGAGDLLTPSGACFTACWLTPAGVAVAERLLSEHPEWKSRLTGGVEGV